MNKENSIKPSIQDTPQEFEQKMKLFKSRASSLPVKMKDIIPMIGGLASLLSLIVGIIAIGYAYHVYRRTETGFERVNATLERINANFNDVHRKLEQLDRRDTISEIKTGLLSSNPDLYINLVPIHRALMEGYAEVNHSAPEGQRYQINQEGRNLITKVYPMLRTNYDTKTIRTMEKSEFLFKLGIENLYNMVRNYNDLNDPDVSPEAFIGVIVLFGYGPL